MKRAARIALAALALAALVLAAAAVAFLAGIDTDGEFLRARLERALTAGFGVPTRIEGPIRLRTGRVATIAADAMVLADPTGPAGSTFARGVRPSARIDLEALLLRRTVALEEVTGERLQLELRRQADGSANWERLFTRASPSAPTVSFAGIERLRIERIEGSYRRQGEAVEPFSIGSVDAALPLGEVAVAGTLQLAGQSIGFDLRAARLLEMKTSDSATPIKGSLSWRGVAAAIEGRIAGRGTRLEAAVQASAIDARPVLEALGLAAQEPGALAVTGQLTLTAAEATADPITVTLGRSDLSGRASVAWDGPQPRIELDLQSRRLDTAPFFAAASLPDHAAAPQRFIEALHVLATDADLAARLAIDDFRGLPVDLRSLRLQLGSGARAAEARGNAVLAGTPVKFTLDYDARSDRRRVELGIEGGAASTAALPPNLHLHALDASATSVRGKLHGEGADPAAIVTSFRGDLDARGVRWSLARDTRPTVSGRFETLRVAVQGARSVRAEAIGRLGGSTCSANLTGGAPALMLAGGRWPLKVSGTCPGERLSARGWVELDGRHPAAELDIEMSTDRHGVVARLIGVPDGLPRPAAATGTVTVDDQQAHAHLAALRLGRTSARSADLVYPLGRDRAPHLRLALRTLDLDEFGAAGETGSKVPGGPLERRLLRKELRLPDLDFDLAAERVDVGKEQLRNVTVSGLLRDGRLPPAPFRLQWDGLAMQGRVGLDLTAPNPHLQFEAQAANADLAPLLKRLGIADVRLTAVRMSVSADARGERLADLLATATLEADAEQARFDLSPRRPNEAGHRGDVSARLTAAAGRETRLAARGSLDGWPIDIEASSAGLDAWSRPDAPIALTLRSTFGDLRVDLRGQYARDGNASANLRLAGARLDELGLLFGLTLPAVAYEGRTTLTVGTGAFEFSDLALRFGRSQVAGSLRIDRRNADRPRHVVALRSQALHLEDLGAERWLRPDRSSDAQPAAVRLAAMAPTIEHGLAMLRGTDLDASIRIDELHAGGESMAAGVIRASADGGRLRVRLDEVQAKTARVDADFEVDAGAAPPRYRLGADLRDLDYGPLVRAYDPGSRLGGRLNFIADLASSGSPGDVVSRLAGTLDVAVFPQGIESRALDLWGTALISGILRQVDPNARTAVECSVAGFDIADGVATSNGLFVDTTRMRIYGDVQIDIATRQVSGRINARSNEPHLFTFAPTMVVSGPVERPTLSAAPESVVLVPLRFVAPLARFGRDWLRGGGRTAERRAGCEAAFEAVRRAHFGGTAAH